MATTTTTTITLPTVKELNDLTCSKNCLMLLRVLCTSDLSWFHDLLKEDTRKDIIKTCNGLLEIEMKEECHGLGDDELVEFREHIFMLRESVNWEV